MPDQPTFVINDRRKFTSEGELRHESSSAPSPTESGTEPVPASAAHEPTGPAVPESSQRMEPHANTQADATLRGPQLVAGDPFDSSDPSHPSEPSSHADGQDALPSAPDAMEAVSGTTNAESSSPSAFDETGTDAGSDGVDDFGNDAALPPGPSAEQAAEATRAYEATVERLDIAMRAANPGGDRMPPMTFDRLVQSLYTQALLLLGGAAEPGETPRVDILGGMQTIDMLSVLYKKTAGNLSPEEDKLLSSALFDLQMAFLEITQALARQAAQRQPGPATPGGLPPLGGAGPRIVR